MSAEKRLVELKLELPPARKPVAVYRTVVLAGNVAYVSGHGPLKSDGTMVSGRVGADLDLAAGKAAARQTGLAILASLRAQLGSLDRVSRLLIMFGIIQPSRQESVLTPMPGGARVFSYELGRNPAESEQWFSPVCDSKFGWAGVSGASQRVCLF